MNKVLTISIAAYNVEEYLAETLDSCIVHPNLQSYLEVLIVDDGSTDGTLEIAQEYEKEYPEVFHVISKENGGYGSTINAALKIATGKYFRILDGDDWVDTSVLESLLQNLQECQEDVIFTHSMHVLMNGNIVLKRHIVRYGVEEPDVALRIKQNCKLNWVMHNMTVRTDLLVKNNVSIMEHCFYTDGEFVFYVMAFMKTYRCKNIIFYQHRIGRVGQSVSREGRIRHKEDYFKVLKQELNWLKLHEICDSAQKNFIIQHVTNTATGVIEYYLLCPCNHANKEVVKKIDLYVQENNKEIFDRMYRKKAIWILRFFNYHSYRICQWNELYKMKSIKNM